MKVRPSVNVSAMKSQILFSLAVVLSANGLLGPSSKEKEALTCVIQEFQKYWSITALVCKITYFNGRNIDLVGLYSQILVWLFFIFSVESFSLLQLNCEADVVVDKAGCVVVPLPMENIYKL